MHDITVSLIGIDETFSEGGKNYEYLKEQANLSSLEFEAYERNKKA